MRGSTPTPGCGRISRVRLAMRARGRSFGPTRAAVGGACHGPGAGHLVHGLARGRRGGRGWSAPTAPVAVTLANRVIACSASARSAGVRRGLRRRESQARCPQLHVVTADPARDARHFENVTAAVDDLVPGPRCCGRDCWCCRFAGRPATSGPSRPLLSGWSTRWPRPGPNARSVSPTSCPPRSSPRGPAGSSTPDQTRCSCPRCRSGSWPPSRAWRRPVVTIWRICCGA